MLDAVKAALPSTVEVFGRIYYDKFGMPRSIYVDMPDSLKIVPPDSDLPSLDEIWRILEFAGEDLEIVEAFDG
jgi:hypothetical protein